MVEKGKKKKAVASAFDWPGWDRSAKSENDALAVLATYRQRYAAVAQRAGLSDEFGAAGELAVVERLDGTGMTDFYGVSARSRLGDRRQGSIERNQKPPRESGREPSATQSYDR